MGVPNNLPHQPTSFIGREKEVAEVKVLLTNTRLLTLTGMGGSGKTRLSLQIAHDLLDDYPNGVWQIKLDSLSDSTLLPQTIADLLGVKEEASKTIQQSLIKWLRPKHLLLVLDNCEHLLNGFDSFTDELLGSCTHLHILATSRERLNVSGEQTYPVPLLSIPDPKSSQTAADLSGYESVALFIQRAQAVRHDFAVTDANAPAVAQICWRLDGIPLAIELAAARVRVLSAEEINTHLDQDSRFRLLTGGARDTLPRQQTLRALIDWSHDLLTNQEKSLLRRLSVFAGGWTLSAAEVVCAGAPVEDFEVLDLLTALVDKSLVVAEPAGDGTRYRLLETIRQYGGDRLGESGEVEAVSGRAAACFLALAEEAEQQLEGPERRGWFSRLEAEHDNLRASLSWSLSWEEPLQGERSKDGVLRLANDGLRLAASLWEFWFVRGHLSEGRRWLDLALARSGVWAGEASAARAKALHGAGNLAWLQGYYTEAQVLLEESLILYRQLGDQKGTATTLMKQGWVAWHQGDYAGARDLHKESLVLFQQLGDQSSIASTLMNLANVAQRQGDFAGARALYEESLSLYRQSGDQRSIAFMLGGLGRVAQRQDDYMRARALHEESLNLFRQLGDQNGIANVLGYQGLVAQNQGDFAGARALYEESLSLFRQVGDQQGIVNALSGLGIVAQRQSQMERSARLSGAFASLRDSIGNDLDPMDQEEMDIMLTTTRVALGDDAFAAAWDAGRAMTLDEAVEYALGENAMS